MIMYPINMLDFFEETVKRQPTRISIHDNEEAITFAQLRNKALALAEVIREALDGKVTQIIGVHAPKSSSAVVMQLAILYSGNAYMNLNVNDPMLRQQAIVDTICPVLIISSTPDFRPQNVKTIFYDYKNAPASPQAEVPIAAYYQQLIDADPMCVINTSGSTGVPKGIALSHRNFIDFMGAVKTEGLVQEAGIAASLVPIVFDVYSFELCLLMAQAFTLVLVPHSLAAFPRRILELMIAKKVSFIFWVPTIMVNIANMKLLDSINLPDLRQVWFIGEVFPTPHFNYWRSKLPGVQFANFYGPAEITIACFYHIANVVIPDNESIPLGKPMRNTAALILDEEGNEVNIPGVLGELCIRGSGVTLGYCNDFEKTNRSFTQNPLNKSWPERIYHTGDLVAYNNKNDLIYKGRRDNMIKIRGYRVELGEIDRVAVALLEEVANCCSVYSKEKQKIALFYEAETDLEPASVLKRLASGLPRYMLPTVFIRLEALPMNTNGKLDRKKCSELFSEMIY